MMFVGFILRLFALLALLAAPVGMMSGHAMAMPAERQGAAAHDGHCADMDASGGKEAPARAGSEIDCAIACACVQPLGITLADQSSVAPAPAALLAPGITPSRNPAADPPPPRAS